MSTCVCHNIILSLQCDKERKSNNKKIKIMKKYFVNGKEISEKEAKLIEKRNKEYMESGDFSLMAECEFITVINVK